MMHKRGGVSAAVAAEPDAFTGMALVVTASVV